MTTSLRRPIKGFTLIELLTVIAIIGILAAIIIPTVGQVRKTAQKTQALGNIREIGKGALLYAADNRDFLPGKFINTTTGSSAQANALGFSPTTVDLYAFALAKSGGLNDALIWVNNADESVPNGSDNTRASTVISLTGTGTPPYQTDFAQLTLGYGVVCGLSATDTSTTPIAFTRGILGSADGKWSPSGVYKNEGGHIFFVGGNVAFYKNLGTSEATGELINSVGDRTRTILNTIKNNKFMIEEAPGAAAALTGTGT
jgi:prepilin-type N-terminal cleavage/methylation domain-containing protein